MGLTCPAGFMPFASYNEAVSAWTRNTKKFQELNSAVPELSQAEAYFGAILASRLAGHEKVALIWCYNGQSSEKEIVDVEWILNTVQASLEKLGVTVSALFPLARVFRATLRIIHPTYAPDEMISSGVFAAFTVFVPEVREYIHGSYSVKKGAGARIGHGEQEFEVFKFLRSLQNRLRKATMAEKAEVLQRGIRRLPAPLKTPLRRRLASNDAPIGWHEYCKWLAACPSLGTTKLPKSSDSSLRGMVDWRAFEARKHLDETFQFFEELSSAQHYDFGNMTAHLKPASVRDVLVRYRVIPVEVMEALEYINIKSLTEGAFMLFFVPPSLWETDPVCALDMLGNFRRAVLQANAPCGRPQSVPHKTDECNERATAAFDVESCKQFIADMKLNPPQTQPKRHPNEDFRTHASFSQRTLHPSQIADDRSVTGVNDETQTQLISTLADDATASPASSTLSKRSMRSGNALPNPIASPSPARSPTCANDSVPLPVTCGDDSVPPSSKFVMLETDGNAEHTRTHVCAALDAEENIDDQTIGEDIVMPPACTVQATKNVEHVYIDGEEHVMEDGVLVPEEENAREDDDFEIPEELERTVSPVKQRTTLSPPETPIDLAPSPECDFLPQNNGEMSDTTPSDDDALPHAAQCCTTKDVVARVASPMLELHAGAGRPATPTRRRRPSLRLEMNSAQDGVDAGATMDTSGRDHADTVRGSVVNGHVQQESELQCTTKCSKQENTENACRVRKASSPQRRRQHFAAIT
eukprot:GEMP01024738.1.p1 GENE.GEMP01024738.1~~GEMP01024738.1.p1  ORF type:complete len:771 (+),score=157.29 GEMP01024738.1:49-2313(+)